MNTVITGVTDKLEVYLPKNNNISIEGFTMIDTLIIYCDKEQKRNTKKPTRIKTNFKGHINHLIFQDAP